MTSDAYASLCAHLKQTAAIEGAARLLTWDQEAMMPPKGADQRAEQAGALAAVLHERNVDPRIDEWLAAIDVKTLDSAGQANVRHARRVVDRISRVPPDLSARLARTTAHAHNTWAQSRADDDVPSFLPVLEEIISLTREYAGCVADGGDPYDALLDDYEPGAEAAEIAETFARLRAGLSDLRTRLSETSLASPKIKGTFSKNAQLVLARQLAETFGYDADAGRIDLVVHPFCSGTRGDVRITTRVDESDPFNCLYSTIHETGHALYEQGLAPELSWQPAGEHASMGVHESQSRLCENQIGRSEPFCNWLFPKMRERFGDLGIATGRDFYLAVNRVEPGYIRTEADEVHYNLHIMLRFELERALISGDLLAKDLEAAWNDRFHTDFGVTVDKPSNGVLQDVHWSAGLFGYFPTYALGNIYAGCLFQTMQDALPNMYQQFLAGDLKAATAWLGEHVHRQGALRPPRDIIAQACGTPPTEQPLLSYLNTKFSELYAV